METTVTKDTLIDERYRVISRVGSGGMADVFCAEDQQLGRKVAVKLLHRRFAQDAEFVERFRREASSAAGLQHPNVVSVFDRGEWDGTYYIAMEYLDGRSLKQIIREEAPLAPARAVDLIIQVLKAARFAHRRGVIHRDIKPHNVIVDAEDRAKVTDFGIARAAGSSDMTETGSIMGTAQYLSPEQAQGHPVSAQSDIYSTGVVLYELLTGEVPFKAESPVSVALKHVSEAPIVPRQLNPEVSPELEFVVLTALSKNPDARYSDADEFIAALEGARDAPPDAAATTVLPAVEPVVPYPPLAERPPRNWAPWLWGLLVALLLAGGILLYFLLSPAKVSVPNVVGLKADTAAQILRNKGFDVNIEQVRSATVPRDRVSTQSPQPGQRAKEGSTVTIVVSTGQGIGTIPDVRDLAQKEAETRLKAAGYVPQVVKRASNKIKPGRAIDTDPRARAEFERGQTVTLFISSGPKKITVPNVVNMTSDDARTALEDLKLKVNIVEQESPDVAAGTVMKQDPVADTKVDEGSTVNLTVAKEPTQVAVPDVVGETVDNAVNALTEAGFKVKTRLRSVSTSDEDGLVLDQKPVSPQIAKKGTRVTIFVGRFNPAPGLGDGTPTPTP